MPLHKLDKEPYFSPASMTSHYQSLKCSTIRKSCFSSTLSFFFAYKQTHLRVLISCQILESVMLMEDLIHILSTHLVLTLHVKILF